ncbi:MAG TPA: nuclear transport factor 2 family protein [Acidimicrobiia bacterium]|nr:nuclear transport factor 2 family protein [Acidimicrobiia bacterium]
MPDPAHIVRVFEEYTGALTRGDAAAAAALFAPDAVVRDPIDGPVLEGTAKIREFFAGGEGILHSLELTGPVRIAGDGVHAAAPMRARLDFGDGPKLLDTLDVMTFDDDGRVVSMDAFYGPSNFTDAT